MTNTLVLVHGAFAGPWCMDTYRTFFRDRGWDVHAPALRFHDGDPKSDPDPAFAEVSIADYTEDVAAFVARLDTRPVILGHAVGGLIAQQVACRGLARAIVLINPNPPWGSLPTTDDERAVARGLMEAGAFWKAPMRVEFDLIANYAFNKLDPDAQRRVFERLGPESGRVMFEMFFWMFDDHRAIAVDVDKVACPVLVVSGAEDRAVHSETGADLARRYGDRGTFHLARDHAHFLFMEPGWERVAAVCADWMAGTPG